MATGGPQPSTIQSVLAASDVRTTSSSYYRLPESQIPSLLTDYIVRLKTRPADIRKLGSINSVTKVAAYTKVKQFAQIDATLLLAAVKDARLKTIQGKSTRTSVLRLISDAVMIFMDVYIPIVYDVPTTRIIAEKTARDVYFHLVKRLPEFIERVGKASDQAEEDKVYAEALVYARTTALRPAGRFISIVLGELNTGASRSFFDKRAFKKEQREQVDFLKAEFKTRKSVYKKKWSSLRNEALATMSNLDVEIGAANSPKVADILRERRSRIDGFLYNLEQGVQSIQANNFPGFVSAKIAIEDSLIEYSKRLEFRTLARLNKDLEARQKYIDSQPSLMDRLFDSKGTKKKPSDSNLNPREFRRKYGYDKPRSTGLGTAPRFNKSLYRYLGPAGLLLYGVHSLALNRYTVGATKGIVGGLGKASWWTLKKAAGAVWWAAKNTPGALATLGAGAINAAGVIAPYLGKAAGAFGSAGAASWRATKSAAAMLSAASTKAPGIARRIKRRSLVAGGRTANLVGNVGRQSYSKISSLVGKASSYIGSLSSGSSTQQNTGRVEPDMSGLFNPASGNLQQQSSSAVQQNTSPPSSNSARNNSSPLPATTPSAGRPDYENHKDPWILDILDELLDDKLAELTELARQDENIIKEGDLDSIEDRVEDVLEWFLFDFPEKPSSNTTSSSSNVTQVTDSSQVVNNKPSQIVDNSNTTSSSSNVTQVTPTKAPDYRSPEAIAREEDYSRNMAEAIARSNKIQEELEEIKNKLNRAIQVEATTAASNVTGAPSAKLTSIKERVLERIRSSERRISNKYSIKNLLAKSYSTLRDKITSFVTSPEEKAALPNNALARVAATGESAQRRELISVLKKLATPKSEGLVAKFIRSLVSFGPRISGMLGSLGGAVGKLAAPALTMLAAIAPRLAMAALPLVAVAGSLYAGWTLGSKLYEKYAAEIVDGIEWVVKKGEDIINEVKAAYDWLVETVKNPSARVSEIKDKVKAWAASSPTVNAAKEAIKSAPSKAVAAAKEAGSAVVAGAKDLGSAAVDKVTSAASGAKTYISDKVGRLFSTNKASVNFDGLNPGTKDSFVAMAEDYRKQGGKRPLNIESARRTTEQQEKLYRENPTLAAKPGRSLHEQGRALDIDRATAGELEKMGLLQKYGFARNVKGEPWHISHDGNNYSKPNSSPSRTVSKDASSKTTVAPSPTPAASSAPANPAKNTSVAPQPAAPESKPVSQSSSAAPTSDTKVAAAPSPAPSSKEKIPTFSYDDPTMFMMNMGVLA